uniref:Uncharacterized protein n=1 Tax=Plectus sambesii TaxID=2011161 RepID=A0A914W683_9BILA
MLVQETKNWFDWEARAKEAASRTSNKPPPISSFADFYLIGEQHRSSRHPSATCQGIIVEPPASHCGREHRAEEEEAEERAGSRARLSAESGAAMLDVLQGQVLCQARLALSLPRKP